MLANIHAKITLRWGRLHVVTNDRRGRSRELKNKMSCKVIDRLIVCSLWTKPAVGWSIFKPSFHYMHHFQGPLWKQAISIGLISKASPKLMYSIWLTSTFTTKCSRRAQDMHEHASLIVDERMLINAIIRYTAYKVSCFHQWQMNAYHATVRPHLRDHHHLQVQYRWPLLLNQHRLTLRKPCQQVCCLIAW